MIAIMSSITQRLLALADAEVALTPMHLAREVQQARACAELLSLRTVRERLDGWRALHGELPARGRWIDVAQEIGVTPEALYRELARKEP